MSKKSSLTETVQAMYAAFGRGDVPAILARLHPDIEWRLNADPAAPGAGRVAVFRTFRGPKEVGEFFATLARELEFHTFQPTAFFASDRGVAARVTIETTTRATGRRLRVESMHVFTFDGSGRLTEFREFTDTLGVAGAWDAVHAKG